MARKPLQFQAPERLHQEIENWVKDRDITLSEFLRNSAKFYMILRNYTEQGYKLILRKEDETAEKEFILS